MPTISAASTPSRRVTTNACSIQTDLMRAEPILKMNFNFNFKDILRSPGASIRRLTTGCDSNHTVEITHQMVYPNRGATACPAEGGRGPSHRDCTRSWHRPGVKAGRVC